MSGGTRHGAARLRAVPDLPDAPNGSDEHVASGSTDVRRQLQDLLPQVADGDEDAFASLYDAIAPSVYGLTKRVLRQVEQAEEVTQEVLIEVWQQARRYDAERGSPLAWVLTIAHRRAVDRVRAAQATAVRDFREGVRTHPVPHDDVLEAVEGRLEAQAVRNCVDELTEVQRESVTLAYFGGHTYAEVAAILRVPLGTIKTRLRDGLIRLRDCMGVA